CVWFFVLLFFFSSRRRHTRFKCDWSSDVCSSDLAVPDVSTETGLRDKAILELMYAAGLRVSEVVDLEINNVDLDVGILTCKGKRSEERRVGKEWRRQWTSEKEKRDEYEQTVMG